MVDRDTLVQYLEMELQSASFKDYCPNGLQVEGKRQIRHIVSGVTASQRLVDAAINDGADALLVHHGYFWRNEAAPVVGMKQRRLAALLRHDINLLAYHLPLDVHPRWGNNTQLALRLGLTVEGPLEPDNPGSIGLVGVLDTPLTVQAFAQRIETALQRTPLLVLADGREAAEPLRRIAWCTGAAQGYIDLAARAGVDAYLTGEASEPTVHSARELGLHFIAAGHHATERYGVQALGQHLAQRFGISHRFIDIDNPV